ncbi:MAG: M20/M25/M40 family metallo-hydrolase [Chloroherpetonaceae bacterium]|nr:M20/M25/M40 family metallo-hydrolase [Chloroherpetonaceae bacterium]MDW8437270.1 M20/M25/M40 family metallo-hydrolase [Chloroherpetonaceae bacterium]
MKRIFVLFIVFFFQAAFAQEPVDTAFIAKLKDEGLNRSQAMDIASMLTDVYGPRLTGSRQLLRASEWAKSKFEEWGLKNSKLEPWSPFGKGWELKRYSLIARTPYASFPVTSFPKAWSEGKRVKGEAIFLDIKDEADFKKYKGKLRDKFALISDYEEPKLHEKPIAKRHDAESLLQLANATVAAPSKERFQLSPEDLKRQQLNYLRMQFLFEEKPLAILDLTYRGTAGSVALSTASMPIQPSANWRHRPRPYQTASGEVLTQISLNPEHYGRIYRLLKKGVKVELELDMETETYDATECYNVVAEIEGSDLKDELVMMGAHLDSWHAATGATDNAAGSAIMMEAIRLLKTLGVQPRRTIRIALWSGEEQGLLGSAAYVRKRFGKTPDYLAFSDDGKGDDTLFVTPQYEKFCAYFNVDNGGGQIRGIYLQQNEKCRPIFRAWLEPFKDWNATTVSLSNTGGTDHLSFDAIGLPGFQFIQDPMEYGTWTHHSTMDSYERLVEEDMKRNAVIVASFVYHAAMRDEKLPRKPLKAKVAVAP